MQKKINSPEKIPKWQKYPKSTENVQIDSKYSTMSENMKILFTRNII